MAIKIVIGDPKTGKTKQFEIEDMQKLRGKSIGDTITIDLPELGGYELEVTGGSDSAGFPMRADVEAPKKRILAVSGIGLRASERGRRRRKMVAGRMITERTAQLNCKIAKYGKQDLFAEPQPEEPADEKPQGTPEEAPKKEETPKGDA